MSAPMELSLLQEAKEIGAERLGLTEEEFEVYVEDLANDWESCARPSQLPPDAEYSIWLILAGRGFGKTRTGAEEVKKWARTPKTRIALIGPTLQDVIETMIEGPSGILSLYDDDDPERPKFVKAPWPKLVWPNGSIAQGRGSEKPDRLRGPNFHKAWCDEIAGWQRFRAKMTWNMLRFALRLPGQKLQTIVTTTPKSMQLLRDILERKDVSITKGSTYDNANNLGADYIEEIEAEYEGTRLGRQEMHGEMLEVGEGIVYPEFLPRRNVIPWRYDPGLRTVLAIDPGVRKWSVVLAQQTSDEEWWVDEKGNPHCRPKNATVIFDELHPEGESVQQAMPKIVEMLERWGVTYLDAIYCDPAAKNREQGTGRRTEDIIREGLKQYQRQLAKTRGHPLVYYSTSQVSRSIPNGIDRVRAALESRIRAAKSGGFVKYHPTLYVSDRCYQLSKDSKGPMKRGVVVSFGNYSYPEARPDDDHPQKDGTFDHAMDTVRYLVVFGEDELEGMANSAAPSSALETE